MDKILKMISEWDNQTLLNTISEMKQDEPLGLISNGRIKALARLIVAETKDTLPLSSALRLAQDLSYKEAANRWYNIYVTL